MIIGMNKKLQHIETLFENRFNLPISEKTTGKIIEKTSREESDEIAIEPTGTKEERPHMEKNKRYPHKPKRQDLMNEILNIHQTLRELKSNLAAQE